MATTVKSHTRKKGRKTIKVSSHNRTNKNRRSPQKRRRSQPLPKQLRRAIKYHSKRKAKKVSRIIKRWGKKKATQYWRACKKWWKAKPGDKNMLKSPLAKSKIKRRIG